MLMEELRNFTPQNEMERVIADIILKEADNDEHLEAIIHDILDHGCCSGVLPDFVEVNGVETFFKTHHKEVFETLKEDKDMITWSKEIIEGTTAELAHRVLKIAI